MRDAEGTRWTALRPDAAGFLRKVLPGGVPDCEGGVGVFCCFRYSWIERVWTGAREEVELWIEWCGECTGVVGPKT